MPESRIEHATRNPYIRLLALLVAIFLFGWIVYGLRGVLTPVFLSFLIAYLLDPVVDWFERRRINRSLAIFILLIGLFLGAIVMVLLIALAVRDLRDVVVQLPVWLEEQVLPWLEVDVLPWLTATLQVELDPSDLLGELRTRLTTLAPRLAGPAQTILTSALSGTMALVAWLANVILIPLFSFYLLRDFDRIIAKARGLVPPKHEEAVLKVFREIDETIAAFVRGQLMVMLILGILYAAGLAIFKVKLGIGIGLLAGLLCVIPYLGFIVGIGLAVIMSLMGGEHLWLNLIGTGVTFGVVQALEGTVITPKVVGDKVGLHPVWVIVAVMVGANALGVLGMLLAVPAAAVIKILLSRARDRYKESSFFRDEPEEDAEPDAALPPLQPDRTADEQAPAPTEEEPEPAPEEPPDEAEPAEPPPEPEEAAPAEEEAPEETDEAEPESDSDEGAEEAPKQDEEPKG